MDVDTFIKICKDCNFYNENFHVDDAACLFARVIPGSRGKMNAEEFDFALSRVAEMRLRSLNAFARSYARRVTLDGDMIFTKARQSASSRASSCTASVSTNADRASFSSSSSMSSLPSPEISPHRSLVRSPSQLPSSGHRSPQTLPPVAPKRHSWPRSPPIKSTASCPRLPRRRASVGAATHPLGCGW